MSVVILSVAILSVVMLSEVMLSIISGCSCVKGFNGECRYTECHYVECRGASVRMTVKKIAVHGYVIRPFLSPFY